MVEHEAVLVFPLPVNAIAAHPLIVVPLSVKRTDPEGALPDTDAVNVTLEPVLEGFDEDVKVVDVAAGPATVCPPVPT